MQLRLDFAVAVAIDDARGEVGVAARGGGSVRGFAGLDGGAGGLRVGGYNETEVHETTQEDLVVFEYVADVFDAHFAFDG